MDPYSPQEVLTNPINQALIDELKKWEVRQDELDDKAVLILKELDEQ